MIYYIEKRFEFEAAHQLSNLPPSHQCYNLHGHSYGLVVTLESKTLDTEVPWVADFAVLSDFVKPVIAEKFEHRVLNRSLGCESPTAEFMAAWWWKYLQEKMRDINLKAGVPLEDVKKGGDSAIYLHEVRIQETRTSAAYVRGGR